MTKIKETPIVDGELWKHYLNAGEFVVARMLIDPSTAQEMLQQNTRNRTLSTDSVRKMTVDMLSGRWGVLHPDTISFDHLGVMVNGQHRLSAVVASGHSIISLVVFGCNNESRLTVDGHRTKRLGDRLFIAGDGIGDTAAAVGMCSQIATRMANAHLGSKRIKTPVEQAEFIELHHGALSFVMEEFGHRKIPSVTTAPVKAVFANAWYHVPHDTLRRAIHTLLSGEMNTPIDRNLVIARRWLTDSRVTARNSNSAGSVYRRIGNAVRCYANNRPLKILKDINYDPFPLPDGGSPATEHLGIDRMALVDTPNRTGRSGATGLAH